MASGPCAAPTGRRHGRTDQPSQSSQITLANGEPSRHGALRTPRGTACDSSEKLGRSCVDGSRIARADVRFGVVVGCSLVFDLFARRMGRWP